MFVEVAGTEAAKLAWENRETVLAVAKKVWKLVTNGRLRVVVFGAGGVGKSTVGKLLSGKLSEAEVVKNYDESTNTEDFSLKGTLLSNIKVAPGQERRQWAWPELIKMISSGNVNGIINVVAWGHHSVIGLSSFTEHKLYRSGMSKQEFVELYLDSQREREIKQLATLMPHISMCKANMWMISLVTKQDLWWNHRDRVKTHYSDGAYNDVVESIRKVKGEHGFPHELLSVALTLENLVDNQNNTWVPTTSGYDQRLRLANLAHFSRAFGQLTGTLT